MDQIKSQFAAMQAMMESILATNHNLDYNQLPSTVEACCASEIALPIPKRKRTYGRELSSSVDDVLDRSLGPLCTQPPGLSMDISPIIQLLTIASRDAPGSILLDTFAKCWTDNPKMAVQAMLFIRDHHSKQGERDVFYTLCIWLRQFHPHTYILNLKSIMRTGYFKDLLKLSVLAEEGNLSKLGVKDFLELEILAAQLKSDQQQLDSGGSGISLAAKWAPSEKLGFDKKHKLAKRVAKLIFGSESHVHEKYRKLLTRLRALLDIVEVKMCARRWTEIEYENVPLSAHAVYRKAFVSHDESRYLEAKKQHTLHREASDPAKVLGKYFDPNSREDPQVELNWSNLVDAYTAELGGKIDITVILADDSVQAKSLALLLASCSRIGNLVTSSGTLDIQKRYAYLQARVLANCGAMDPVKLDGVIAVARVIHGKTVIISKDIGQIKINERFIWWDVPKEKCAVNICREGGWCLTGSVSPYLLRFCKFDTDLDSLLEEYEVGIHPEDTANFCEKSKVRDS